MGEVVDGWVLHTSDVCVVEHFPWVILTVPGRGKDPCSESKAGHLGEQIVIKN